MDCERVCRALNHTAEDADECCIGSVAVCDEEEDADSNEDRLAVIGRVAEEEEEVEDRCRAVAGRGSEERLRRGIGGRSICPLARSNSSQRSLSFTEEELNDVIDVVVGAGRLMPFEECGSESLPGIEVAELISVNQLMGPALANFGQQIACCQTSLRECSRWGVATLLCWTVHDLTTKMTMTTSRQWTLEHC